MTISRPPVNAGQLYINGLNLSWISGTEILVNAGLCRDSTNSNDINVGLSIPVAATPSGVEPVAAGTGPVTINAAVNGAAGLDTGVLADSLFYAVYAIGDSYGQNPGSALLSLESNAAPYLPSGYDMYFRIGYVLTSGAAAILAFRQEGAGLDRWMWYDAAIPTSITAGASATYVAVDAHLSLPLKAASIVNWAISFAPSAAGSALVLVPGLSSAAAGYATLTGSTLAVGNLICPADLPLTDAVNYKVAGTAAAIDVQAYLDQLGLVATDGQN